MNLDEIKEKEKKLEDLLRKESHISFLDKVKNFGSNMKKNAPLFILPGISLVGAGLVVYCGYNWSQHGQAIAPLNEAHEYLGGLKSVLETAVENKIDITLEGDILENVRIAAEQTVQNYDIPETQELVSLLHKHPRMLQGDNLQGLSVIVENLYGKTASIVEGAKSVALALCTVVGGGIDAVCWIASAATFFDWSSGFCWEDHLSSKKRSGRRFKADWPTIRDKLRENPNAGEIYEFIDSVRNTEITTSTLLDLLKNLEERNDSKFKPVIKAMTLHPENYFTNGAINEAFRNFEAQLKKDGNALEKIKQSSGKDEVPASYLHRPITYSEIYLSLLSKGWEARRISNTLSETESFETGDFFREKLLETGSEELYLNVLSFYKKFGGISKEKRLAIAEYLFQKGNKQLASQLASCKIYDRKLLEYLESVDKLPNVGVKGQVRTLVKLNNAVHQLNPIDEEYSLERLVDLLDYDRPKFEESALEVAEFLRRHPDLPVDKVLGTLSEYFFLTDGDKFRSKWVKKERHRIGKQKLRELRGVLDKKGERKFLEELERKIKSARFDAFDKEIENLYYAPLDKILGERVERRGFELTDELMNVVTGYHGIKYGEEFKPLLRGLLKAYVANPECVQDYLSNLPGNRSLEERVGRKVLSAWKRGHSQFYEAGIDRDMKNRLKEQAEYEEKEFMRCVKALSCESKIKIRNKVKRAEAIFKELCKQKIPDEKKYLLIQAKDHLGNLKQKMGIVQSGARGIRIYDSKNPIEAMQMGIVSNSCTRITGGMYAYSSVANAIDDNKKVVYMMDDEGKKFGRTLAILTDKGIVTYRKYDHSNLKTDEAWVDYFQSLAREVGKPLIVPRLYAESGLKKALESRGATEKKVSTKVEKAVCSHWYDDLGAGCMNGVAHGVGDDGYKMKFDAYVLK